VADCHYFIKTLSHIKAMSKTALDPYEEIVTDALKSCSAKLCKSFKTAFIQLMILYRVLPRKINFTQTGTGAYQRRED
jgi:hypothetical protein